MDLNKLAMLNSIAEEKAKLEKKSKLIKREIDFIEYTKKYTEIIENIIYNAAQENKKQVELWVRSRDGDSGVYIDSQHGDSFESRYIPTGMRVDYNIYVSDWINIPQNGANKLEFINKGRPSCVAINALAFMNVIAQLKEQGLDTDYHSYIASGTSVWIRWRSVSCNTEYKEDNYNVSALKKKYEMLKELNEKANEIIKGE